MPQFVHNRVGTKIHRMKKNSATPNNGAAGGSIPTCPAGIAIEDDDNDNEVPVAARPQQIVVALPCAARRPLTAALTESKRKKRPLDHEKSARHSPLPPRQKKPKIGDGGGFVMIASPKFPAAVAGRTKLPPRLVAPEAEQAVVFKEEEIRDCEWVREFAKELRKGVAVELLVEKPAEMLRNPSWKRKSFHC